MSKEVNFTMKLEPSLREYQAFLAQKIALSREAIHEGEWYSDAEVEERFAQRRSQALDEKS